MTAAKKKVLKQSAKQAKLIAKNPTTKVKAARVKKEKNSSSISSVVKSKEGDNVLWLNGEKMSVGTVVKATSKSVALSMPGSSKATVNISIDYVLAVCNPAGLKTPDAIMLMPFSGQGFLTPAGRAYVEKNPQPERNKQCADIHVGDTVALTHRPFGYTKHDDALTVGENYTCAGFLGDLIITTSDKEGGFAMYHQDHVVVTAQWKKAA
jgi:hypothetical protein